jgi:hypothetical protein
MISWGAIFAGAFVAFAVNAALMGLGGGIGFSAFDPEQGDAVSKGALIGAGAYWFIAGLISLFAGGYVAARMAGFRDRALAGLHGLCAWALASTVAIGLVATGVGAALGAAVGLVGSGIKGAASTGAAAIQNSGADLSSLRNDVRQLLQPNDQGGVTVNQDAIANLLSQRLGISRDEANALIGQADDQANSVIISIQSRGTVAAGKTADAAAFAGWLAFFSLVAGAIAGYLGGMTGGGPLERIIVRRRSTEPATT